MSTNRPRSWAHHVFAMDQRAKQSWPGVCGISSAWSWLAYPLQPGTSVIAEGPLEQIMGRCDAPSCHGLQLDNTLPRSFHLGPRHGPHAAQDQDSAVLDISHQPDQAIYCS